MCFRAQKPIALRFIRSPRCSVFPHFPAQLHASPVCVCDCVIAVCQAQEGRRGARRLSGAAAHLGSFRLKRAAFQRTQLIETLTNSKIHKSPAAADAPGRRPKGALNPLWTLSHTRLKQDLCIKIYIFLKSTLI